MKKNELVRDIAIETGMVVADVEIVLEELFKIITEKVKEEKICLGSFGAFDTKDKPERKARNPQTGAEVLVPAKTVIVFKPSASLKEQIK